MPNSSWTIEPLGAAHQREDFDCGEPALNHYLKQYARQHQTLGVSRTFTARPHTSNEVIGFYSLAMAAVLSTDLPEKDSKKFPKFPVPMVRLARLAVDLRYQRQGLGEDLLFDALFNSLESMKTVGAAGVLVDAKHEKAKRFYEKFEFESFPKNHLVLWLPLKALKALFP